MIDSILGLAKVTIKRVENQENLEFSQSHKPFKGVNIVVTTHSDGIITTVKEVH